MAIRVTWVAILMLMAAAAAPAQSIAPVQPQAPSDSRIEAERIPDVLELERLKALYFYNLDHKNWEAWRALFTDDAKLLVDRNEGGVRRTDVVEGVDQVMAYVRQRLATTPSVHQGHTSLFEFTSATEARGIWAMSDIIYYAPDRVLYGYGHYRETYRKENGVWRFSSVHLTRLRTEIVNPAR